MSDILIKNMEIPKDSKYVDVRIFRDGTATTSTAEEPFYKKMDVVEVPPHGRLIDADAYRKEIRERYESAREWYNEAEDDEIIGRAEATMITFTECSLTLQNMPTIIESDIDVMYYPQVDGITPTVIKGEAEGCEDG